jgi:hypothetical protein
MHSATIVGADFNILAAFFDANTRTEFSNETLFDFVAFAGNTSIPRSIVIADMFQILFNVLHRWLLVVHYNHIIGREWILVNQDPGSAKSLILQGF